MTFTPISPTRLKGDRPLGRPSDMTDEECGTLYVRVTPFEVFPTTTPESVSRWTPTPEQRQAILNGEDIYLSVIGGHPPVMLYVGDPTLSKAK